MKNAFVLMAFLFVGGCLWAQGKRTCDNSKEYVNDLNSVNKCLINTTKTVDSTQTRELAEKAVVSRRRYYSRRKSYLSSQIGKLNAKEALSVATLLENSKAEKNKKKEDNVVEANKVVFGFKAVDKIPLFKSCKKTSKNDHQNCFNTSLNTFINDRIKYPKKAIKKGIIGDVNVKFRVNKKGKVDNIQISASKDDRLLKKEVARVIEKLPRFIPAEKNGEKTDAEFGFTINFSL